MAPPALQTVIDKTVRASYLLRWLLISHRFELQLDVMHLRLKPLVAVVIFAASLGVGRGQGVAGTTASIATPGFLYIGSSSNLVSISNAVKVVSGLRVGMAEADVKKYLQQHGIVQTNDFKISIMRPDRATTLSYYYPFNGCCGTGLVVEMEAGERPAPDSPELKNLLLKQAYIQSQGANMISITLTKVP